MNLEAFIFSLNTVLAGTDDPDFRAWKRLADDVGVDFVRKTYQELGRVSWRDAVDIVFDAQEMSEAEVQTALERQNNIYQELILKLSPGDVLNGVLELLKELRSAGIRIGVSSEHKDGQKALDALGLSPLVDVIGDGYSVKETLPEPDLLLFIAHEMEVKPENCAVIGDHARGIEAANSAGMYAIGIGTPKQLPGADVVYPSFESITLEKIRADLEAARPY